MNTADQVLNAVITTALELDEASMTRLAVLMRDVKPHHWGSESARATAEQVMDFLDARRVFGYATLRSILPAHEGYLSRLPQAGEIENIRTGLTVLSQQGQRADVQTALREALGKLEGKDPLTATEAASWAAQRLSEVTAGGSHYQHVSEIKSVITHYEELADRPGGIIRLHPAINSRLRWGGLPITDSDGETLLVVARSGHGKTAIAIDTALRIASQGHRVDYDVIADASAYQIRERMVHHIASLPLKADRPLSVLLSAKGKRPAETIRDRLAWAERLLNRLPIEINDAPDLDQHELRVRLAAKRARGVAFSIIENLDHMSWTGPERLERRMQLGELTKICRQFDRAGGHHTMLLVQANRNAEDREDGVPLGADTADSDQPIRHVTIMIGLSNPNVDSPHTHDALHARFGKNRQGTTGKFTLPADLINPEARTPGQDMTDESASELLH